MNVTHIWLAQFYGSGAYNTLTYGGGLHIGPLTLPVTGAGLVATILFALLIALGVFIIARARQRKR